MQKAFFPVAVRLALLGAAAFLAVAVGLAPRLTQGAPALQFVTSAGRPVQTAEANYYYIVGEVRNAGSAPAERITVAARAFDRAGVLVAGGLGYALLEALGPGEGAPFAVALLYPKPQDIARYDLEVTGQEAATPPYREVRLLGGERSWPLAEDRRYLAGEIYNAGASSIGRIKIAVAYYDIAGQIVEVGNIYPMRSLLPPGQKAPFKQILPSAMATSWRLWPQAWPLAGHPLPLAVNIARTYTDDYQNFHLVGEVRNNSPAIAQDVLVVGTFRDEAGRVVNAAAQYIRASPPYIAGGQKAPFGLEVPTTPAFASYELAAETTSTSRIAPGEYGVFFPRASKAGGQRMEGHFSEGRGHGPAPRQR